MFEYRWRIFRWVYYKKKNSSSLNKAIPRKTLPLYLTRLYLIAKKQVTENTFILSLDD